MLNRDVYLKDPTTIKLVNEGVANVNDEKTEQALAVLRYELETFVCDGQYEKGLNHILETYIKNIDQSQQPSVWISGFYGSGKSHLAKMLRALWMDTKFPDGATARGIANLPQSTKDLLKELSGQAKRHGGIHAASGTLGAGNSSNVRLALLSIVFKSCDLPEQYQKAKFVMWLKKEQIYDKIKDELVSKGADWQFEIDNLYVSDLLREAMIKYKPSIFHSNEACETILLNQYPTQDDVSLDEMINAIRMALTTDGKFPLTAIILDEMQQYIGDSSERSRDVGETIEACAKNIGGKLILVTTGQTAITGTPNLKKLEGRFTVRIELSDNDVDTVIRKVFLAKQPAAKASLDSLYKTNIGEISKHLNDTTIAHRSEDDQFFIQDYPILPVRRRFWEAALRVLDQTGTESQLRNQLSTVHKAIQSNVDKPLGSVIPTDFLYFDAADKLLQARLLPRKIYDQTMTWINSSNNDERLLARACGLIFLINKINAHNTEIGIKAINETIADLMLEDIGTDSSNLRNQLPKLLDNCIQVMKVKDEYRIQTEESVAWNNEFQNQKLNLANSTQLIDSDREERLKQQYSVMTKGIKITQGDSKVPRDVSDYYGSSFPSDHKYKLHIWVRNGWSVDEKSAIVDAKQLGNDSPLITVYIPKKDADAIRSNLIEHRAATATLLAKGNPQNAEGVEAKAAIETIKNNAEQKLNELYMELFNEAIVLQSGGNQINESALKNSIEQAVKSSLQRLYPRFKDADDSRWGKVYEKAQKGAPDALKAIDYDGDPASQPVCKALLSYIGNGKKGIDIRKQFDAPPFGWSGDAIDGAMYILLNAGIIKALDERSQIIEPAKLERKAIGKTNIKVESVIIDATHRIKIRKIYQKLNITSKPNDELSHSGDFVALLKDLIDNSGGDAPLPVKKEISILKEISLSTGNERLMAIFNAYDELTVLIDKCKALTEQIRKRLPNWNLLKELLNYSSSVPDIEIIETQVKHIEDNRLLLDEPDPVSPILAALSQNFREILNALSAEYQKQYDKGMATLVNDSNWNAIEPEQRIAILASNQIHEPEELAINVQDSAGILKTLKRSSLEAIRDRIAALPSRFAAAISEAACLLEPKTQSVKLPVRTLKTSEDIDKWLKEINELLNKAIKDGPVIVQ